MPVPVSSTDTSTYGPGGSGSPSLAISDSLSCAFRLTKVSLPPLRHGIARIDGEIEQRRFELARVEPHGPQIIGKIERHLDAFRHAATNPALGSLQNAVDVQRLRVERLPAGESEQLAGQAGAAIDRMANGLVHPADALEVGPALGQFQVAGNDGEKIVEVVGDAAGELSDCFQPLRLQRTGPGARFLHGATIGDPGGREHQEGDCRGQQAEQAEP